jgi:hypothetical protein
MNLEIPLFDGSFAESRHQLTQWRQGRFGIIPSRPLFQKLKRSYQVVMRNKLNFLFLLLSYFIAETIGNAGLLVFQWTLDKDSPRTGYLILVQLTANWPVRLWRAILNTCVLHVVLQALKRRESELVLSDIVAISQIMTWKLFASMCISDIFLASPIAIAQALLTSDLTWSLIYAVFGFLLNWAFGLAQILLFEDSNLSIFSCFVWSAAIALDSSTGLTVFLSSLIIFFSTPLLLTTPFLLVLQGLTFFEVFGYRSAAEICY